MFWGGWQVDQENLDLPGMQQTITDAI